MIIESLRKLAKAWGEDFVVAAPSGRQLTLGEIAHDVADRLIRIFTTDEQGRRPAFGGSARLQRDPHFRDYLLFHEYFDGDDGSGVGASHQTGWTGLVAKLLQQSGD